MEDKPLLLLTHTPKRCEKPKLGIQLLQTQLTLTPFAYLQVTLISKPNLDMSIFAIKKILPI